MRARAAYGDPNGVDNAMGGGSPSPSVPTGPRDRARNPSRLPKSSSRGNLSRTSTMTRTSNVQVNMMQDEMALLEEEDGQPQQNPVMDTKWMLRLRDLEYKLKAEREARVLDRTEAMKRINASENESQQLRENLERGEKEAGQVGHGNDGR